MKIGVTAATGQLGRFVISHLSTLVPSEDIVALVRNPEKGADLGVATRKFDYESADATSLEDIDHLLLISSNEIGQRARQHGNVIAAAKSAGVKWIVYTSILKADTSTISLAGEHLATEKALAESGIDYTVLRNGWYTENYTGSIGGAVANGAFVGSAGEGKIASSARKDFAEAAAVVVSDASHKGNVYELSGDVAYTLSELAAEISKQTGKKIPYQNLPEADYAAILKQVGLPEMFADAIANWDVSASQGDLYDEGTQLSQLIGRPTTSLAKSVEDALASL